MKLPIVLVVWGDAWADMEARTRDDIDAAHTPCITRSVGFLVKRDKIGVTLAGCSDEDDQFDRELFIPAGIVQQVITLKGA